MTDIKRSHVHSNRYKVLRIQDEVNEDQLGHPHTYQAREIKLLLFLKKLNDGTSIL